MHRKSEVIPVAAPPGLRASRRGSLQGLKVRLLEGLCALFTLLIVFAVVHRYRLSAMTRSQAEVCRENLKVISDALLEYRQAHNGRIPVALAKSILFDESRTLYPKYIKSIETLVCPGAAAFLGQRQQWKPGQVTYDYPPHFWVRNLPSDMFKSSEFYQQVVRMKERDIRLAQCQFHPGELKVWAIMWDGAISERPYLFDHYYGRGDRDPKVRAMRERIRKRGGKMAAQ